MNIKEIRTACDMTQKAFCDYFGIPARTLQDWEAEKRTPPEYLVQLIIYKLQHEHILPRP